MASMWSLLYRLSGTALVSVLISATVVHGQSPEAFYRGKTLEFYVGYPPGGGFDIWGRGLIQFMGRHIPGNPNIIIKNMPGAGSLTMLQYMYNRADRSGLAFGILNSSLIVNAVMDPDAVKVDNTKLTWIGNMSSDVKMCAAWAASGFGSVEDTRKRKSQWGGISTQGGGYVATNILRHVVGPNVNHVLGYPSNVDIFLAMERGEADGYCSGYAIFPLQKPDWLTEKKFNIIVQYGATRHREMPDTPTIFELGIEGKLANAVSFLTLSDQMTRPIFAPPGVPEDRSNALRAAFQATMKDPEFLAFAASSKMDLDVKDEKEVAAYVRRIAGTPADAVSLAIELTK